MNEFSRMLNLINKISGRKPLSRVSVMGMDVSTSPEVQKVIENMPKSDMNRSTPNPTKPTENTELDADPNIVNEEKVDEDKENELQSPADKMRVQKPKSRWTQKLEDLQEFVTPKTVFVGDVVKRYMERKAGDNPDPSVDNQEIDKDTRLLDPQNVLYKRKKGFGQPYGDEYNGGELKCKLPGIGVANTGLTKSAPRRPVQHRTRTTPTTPAVPIEQREDKVTKENLIETLRSRAGGWKNAFNEPIPAGVRDPLALKRDRSTGQGVNGWFIYDTKLSSNEAVRAIIRSRFSVEDDWRFTTAGSENAEYMVSLIYAKKGTKLVTLDPVTLALKSKDELDKLLESIRFPYDQISFHEPTKEEQVISLMGRFETATDAKKEKIIKNIIDAGAGMPEAVEFIKSVFTKEGIDSNFRSRVLEYLTGKEFISEQELAAIGWNLLKQKLAIGDALTKELLNEALSVYDPATKKAKLIELLDASRGDAKERLLSTINDGELSDLFGREEWDKILRRYNPEKYESQKMERMLGKRKKTVKVDHIRGDKVKLETDIKKIIDSTKAESPNNQAWLALEEGVKGDKWVSKKRLLEYFKSLGVNVVSQSDVVDTEKETWSAEDVNKLFESMGLKVKEYEEALSSGEVGKREKETEEAQGLRKQWTGPDEELFKALTSKIALQTLKEEYQANGGDEKLKAIMSKPEKERTKDENAMIDKKKKIDGLTTRFKGKEGFTERDKTNYEELKAKREEMIKKEQGQPAVRDPYFKLQTDYRKMTKNDVFKKYKALTEEEYELMKVERHSTMSGEVFDPVKKFLYNMTPEQMQSEKYKKIQKKYDIDDLEIVRFQHSRDKIEKELSSIEAVYSDEVLAFAALQDELKEGSVKLDTLMRYIKQNTALAVKIRPYMGELFTKEKYSANDIKKLWDFFGGVLAGQESFKKKKEELQKKNMYVPKPFAYTFDYNVDIQGGRQYEGKFNLYLKYHPQYVPAPVEVMEKAQEHAEGWGIDAKGAICYAEIRPIFIPNAGETPGEPGVIWTVEEVQSDVVQQIGGSYPISKGLSKKDQDLYATAVETYYQDWAYYMIKEVVSAAKDLGVLQVWISSESSSLPSWNPGDFIYLLPQIPPEAAEEALFYKVYHNTTAMFNPIKDPETGEPKIYNQDDLFDLWKKKLGTDEEAALAKFESDIKTKLRVDPIEYYVIPIATIPTEIYSVVKRNLTKLAAHLISVWKSKTGITKKADSLPSAEELIDYISRYIMGVEGRDPGYVARATEEEELGGADVIGRSGKSREELLAMNSPEDLKRRQNDGFMFWFSRGIPNTIQGTGFSELNPSLETVRNTDLMEELIAGLNQHGIKIDIPRNLQSWINLKKRVKEHPESW